MIISPINNHANRIYSHRTGWGRMWAKCLNVPMGYKADWSRENKVYLEHGMEWKVGAKSINYFLTSEKQLKALAIENQQRLLESKPVKQSSWEKLATKAKMFQDFKGQLFSLDIDCPMYGTLLKTRIKPWVPDVYKNLDFDKIDEVCKKAITVSQASLDRPFFVLGDSHSLSAWSKDAKLCRIDGQTLNGAINKGFDTWIDNHYSVPGNEINNLRVYFGNIDIRHHICRLNESSYDQAKSIRDLVKRYFKELIRVKEKYGIENIEVISLLPIEDVSRKLPKTGYYKGRPYWGDWKDRDMAARNFNKLVKMMCERIPNFKCIDWPDKFLNEQNQLDTKYMERPQSVHISPEHYMWSI